MSCLAPSRQTFLDGTKNGGRHFRTEQSETADPGAALQSSQPLYPVEVSLHQPGGSRLCAKYNGRPCVLLGEKAFICGWNRDGFHALASPQLSLRSDVSVFYRLNRQRRRAQMPRVTCLLAKGERLFGEQSETGVNDLAIIENALVV